MMAGCAQEVAKNCVAHVEVTLSLDINLEDPNDDALRTAIGECRVHGEIVGSIVSIQNHEVA